MLLRKQIIDIILSCGNQSEGVLADALIPIFTDMQNELLEAADTLKKVSKHIKDRNEQLIVLEMVNAYMHKSGVPAVQDCNQVFVGEYLVAEYDLMSDDYATDRAKNFAKHWNNETSRIKP